MFEILPMNLGSAHQVAALEAVCFSDPWSLNSILGELFNPGAYYLTAQKSGQVLGYVGMHKILDEGYITNMAVSPGARRQGIARALLCALIEYARAQAMAFLTLEVREGNQGAISLYSGEGFVRAGLRKGYYNSPPEDALLMTLTLR
ncbi:MAG: ribosomal protein S18-alanine N-acetyltransferase [Oscillospiraceae bacterium]|nr:ribosomal protein S18-alanine N-acetyltransferase [Oscillospiraceae bacterium]